MMSKELKAAVIAMTMEIKAVAEKRNNLSLHERAVDLLRKLGHNPLEGIWPWAG